MWTSQNPIGCSSNLLMGMVIIFLLVQQKVAADYIVFVHGLYGFGPDELLGVGYWGFPKLFGPQQDYIAQLRKKGHQVLYASVGPLSSNHDRAAELYAQIKGTRVDYGAAHSQLHGHARFGKDYSGKGFYPDWDGNHKIHLVGHSMGGNTIRYLEYLLQKGLPEEESQTTDGSISPLYQQSKTGGNNWIHSITTIASPLSGSPMSAKDNFNMTAVHQQMILTFGLVAGLSSLDVDWLYDFDLDHFGLVRQNGESFKSYFNRVFSSPLFQKGFTDCATYDLSAEAVRIFNSKTQLTFPGTYYSAFSTSHTYVCSFSGDNCPEADMEIFLAPMAYSNGHLDNNLCLSDGYCFSKVEWSENDGLVARKSSQGPELGVQNYVRPTPHPRTCVLFKCHYDNSNLLPGIWYTRHVDRDHAQVIGLRFNLLEPDSSSGVYTDIASTIDAIRLSKFTPSEVQGPANAGGNDTAPASRLDSSTLASIVAPVTLGIGMLLAVAGVTVHRRRSQRTKHQMDATSRAASIVLARGHESMSDNPLFQMNSTNAGSIA